MYVRNIIFDLKVYIFLFIIENGSVFNRCNFLFMLKEIVKRINYVDSYIIGYLFRIGVVIFVVKARIEDYFIKFLGRWIFDFYVRYIRILDFVIKYV